MADAAAAATSALLLVGQKKVLGSSVFGTVFGGRYSGEAVAIKQAFPWNNKPTAAEVNEWIAEARLQGRVSIDGVLPLRGVVMDDSGPWLRFFSVMPVMAGSLGSLVSTPGGVLAGADTCRRAYWLSQAAAVLATLHAAGITHGNVKPTNIMLSSVDEVKAEVKVADCGCTLVRNPPPDMRMPHTYLAYVDPAVLGGESATPASDVYSWAITAWQVLSGRVPYEAELAGTAAMTKTAAIETLHTQVCGSAGQRPPVGVLAERGVPGTVIDMIQQCWAADVAMRPTMAAVVAALASYLHPVAVPPPVLTALVTSLRQMKEVREGILSVLTELLSVHDVGVKACSTVLEALAAFTEDVVVVRAACRAMQHMATIPDNRMPLVRAGAHTAVMAAARTHSSDVVVARWACSALQNLASAADNCMQLVRDGAHMAVMAAARDHTGDVVMARAACNVLWYLAAVVGTEVQLVRDGAHTAVMAAAREHAGDVEVARAACAALLNMATADDNAMPLVSDGAHTVVMAAARAHVGDVEVAQDACNMLLCLCTIADARKALVRDGVQAFAKQVAVRHSEDEDVKGVCRLLASVPSTS